MNYGVVYCRCCGQKCEPVETMRLAEDYDPPGCHGILVEDFVSDCCGDALSQVPVTDQCARCGAVAARGSSFPIAPDGTVSCLDCMADYFKETGG